MMTRLFFALPFLFCISCSSQSVYIYQEDGKTVEAEILRDQQKSTFVGVLLTLFPGVLWHGVGHRYAGDTEKAQELEQFEALSLLSSGAGTGLYFAAEEARRRNVDSLKISLYLSAGTFGAFGGIGFLGSWLYDILYTPAAIRKYNRSLYSKPATTSRRSSNPYEPGDW